MSKRVGNSLILFDFPEAFNKFAVGSTARDVKLALFPILELRMLIHGFNDASASHEEDTHDLERGLVSINT